MRDDLLDAQAAVKLAVTLAIPNNFIFAIGHVITQWASLESHIDRELVSLRARPECASMIPPKTNNRFRARIGLWRCMATAVYTTEKDRADIAYIHQNATDIKPRRDSVAHNPFAAFGPMIALIVQKEGQITGTQELTDGATEIYRIAEQISLINFCCLDLRGRH